MPSILLKLTLLRKVSSPFQDSQKDNGLLLQVNSGIFYEFIPADEFFNEHPTRISLKDVKLDKNYAIILNTTAGLWGYVLGDTLKFVSKSSL